MCLDPIKIPCNETYVNTHTIGVLYQILPCGQCAECRKKQAQEYMTRALSEHEYTEEQGGFSYFETFTYSDDTVPTVGDTLCFNTEDRVKFMKRLLTNMRNDGYDVKGNISYFWVSEYGGLTHRPHYHCIFNVRIPGMNTWKFQQYVEKAWSLGIIDHDKTHFAKRINGLGALHYVSKYVSKDDDFVKLLRKKLLIALFGEEGYEWARLYYRRYSLNRLIEKYGHNVNIHLDKYREVAPYHRQSQGFGIHILDQYDIDEMLEKGYLMIKDEKFVKKRVAIPSYIKRKLFYNKVKIGDKVFDRLNSTGIKYRIQHLNDNYDIMYDKYDNVLSNLKDYVDIENIDKINSQVVELLDGNTLGDFITWKMSYQGKWIAESFINRTHLDLCDSRDLYTRYLTRHVFDNYDDVDGRKPIDLLSLQRKKNYDEMDEYLYNRSETDQALDSIFGEVEDFDGDIDRIIIFDDLFPNYLLLDELFNDILYRHGLKKQAAYDEQQALKSKMKLLNSNYRVKKGKKVNKILESIETFAK